MPRVESIYHPFAPQAVLVFSEIKRSMVFPPESFPEEHFPPGALLRAHVWNRHLQLGPSAQKTGSVEWTRHIWGWWHGLGFLCACVSASS